MYAPQYLNNEEEFKIIKSLWDRFKTKLNDSDSQDVLEAINRVFADITRLNFHLEDLILIRKKFKIHNSAINRKDPIWYPYEKSHIATRVAYHFDTLKRHNCHLYNYLKYDKGNQK